MPFSIDTPIKNIPRISLVYQKRLMKLGVKTLQDLFYHFPFRYDDFSKITAIGDLKLNEVATVQGKIIEIKNIRTWRKKMFITEAYVEDSSGTIKAVWFNQPYLADTLKKDSFVSLSGKVNPVRGSQKLKNPANNKSLSLPNTKTNPSEIIVASNRVNFDKALYLSNPAYEKLIANSKSPIGNQNAISYRPLATSLLRHTGRLVPVYPETTGLSSRYLRYLIQIFLPTLAQIKDWLPPEIKKFQRLLDLNSALKQIHFPVSDKAAAAAKRRLAFDELFLIQVFALQQKIKWQKDRSLKIPFDQQLIKKFVDRLPFRLTNAQRQAAWEIIRDLNKTRPMNRLLEGDVGSGKTVVAAMAALSVVNHGWQVTFMAPTEILARQHFKTISELFADYNIKITLLIGGEKSSVKKEIIKQIAKGEIQIIIGTHALIQKGVKFKNLALVVVDEQHRFGVNQRATLIRGQTQENSQTAAENPLLYEDITYEIRKCIFAVRKNIGLGHKENIYQKALEQEFLNSDINFEKEKQINIIYNNKKIGVYQTDFVVEDKIIIELKALPFIDNTEKRQIWTYLKGSGYKLALLVNFSSKDVEIRRIVYDTARLPRHSASSPLKSALVPHLLSMTATPIPRTLALTLYGDLDISLLNEMPAGRQEIITRIVAPDRRQKAYEFIRQQVKTGRQVFVICPRIEIANTHEYEHEYHESQITGICGIRGSFVNIRDVKAVKEEYQKLSEKIFPDLKIAMLHGKMKSKEKEKIMQDLKIGKTGILVSTSVVEVGIDIPNATVMMIEGAERFGLAQLHQFRGRVGRGEYQSYCLLFTDSASHQTHARLKALLTCKNGFELAEKDLAIRGPGEFFGTRQWGLPDLSMASLTNMELIKEARQEAIKILKKDYQLKNYPALQEKLKKFQSQIHLE
jgi:ATP-dependent DNA helicase RecG